MTHSTSHSANRREQINLNVLLIFTSTSLPPCFLKAQLSLLVEFGGGFFWSSKSSRSNFLVAERMQEGSRCTQA